MKEKHSFLRRVVRLCLLMMVLLTVTVIVIAIIQRENIEAGTLGVLMGGWCGELLLSLLKRKFETEDKADRADNESEIQNGSLDEGLEEETTWK